MHGHERGPDAKRSGVPRWLRFLERLLLRGDDAEFLGGDLEEDYLRGVREGRPVRAAARYAADLVLALPRNALTVLARFADDLRYSMRMLRRRHVFSLAAILTLAVGIGATTAIFTVADAVLLRPLPYPEADRLVFLSSSFPGATGGGDQLSYLDVREIADRSRTLESVAAFNTGRALQLRGGAGEPERVRANLVGARYLELLGARASLGRIFGPEDDRVPNGHPVCILTHAFWQRRLGADPAAIGRTLTLSDVTLTIVGVLEPGFRDASPEEGYAFSSDVFLPAMMIPSFGGQTLLTDRSGRNFWAIGRVQPGVAIETARAEIAAIGQQLQSEMASNKGFTFWAERLDAWLARDVRGPILLLLGGSAFVLLIACVNVANLLLAHLSTRGRELAVRRAIGARSGHMASLMFAESFALAIAGGIAGLILASIGFDAFRLLAPGELAPRLIGSGLDVRAFAFAGGVTIAVAVALASASAVGRKVPGIFWALREGAGGTARGGRTRRVLLIAEIATAVVLVTAAHLLLGSLARLRQSDVGFRTERLITLEMDLRSARYGDNLAVTTFGVGLVRELGAIPGAESALLWGPARPGRNTWITFPGREDAPVSGERLMTWRHTISPGALREIGIAMQRGREFTVHDTSEAPRVAIVSETLARTLWPGEDAIGKRVRWRADVPDSPLLTVVGIAADAKHRGRLNHLLYPARDIYVPHAQRAERLIVAVVRASGDPSSIAAAIRGAVRRLDPDLPVFNVTTMREHLAEEEAERSFAAVLMTAYGVVALLLAAIGIYGVLSYQVAVRVREMAVRLALGATRGSVLRLVVLDGMRPALVGIVIGLAGALASTRLLTSLLFGVAPRDPVVLATSAGVLILVALAATVLPAHAATRVDPMTALRAE